ncbi:Molybdate-anion transporter like protein [Verticillium longisporum]|uniref:Molybdate-anion transporter n=2 Tax=Verticillium TaxID=1036719 RepID=A0A8I2ZT25_VERLO|nr:Molybdate-anion transporter like protein [Verticillium longisporum]PNH40495.1 hypothetical protein VD0004_g6488 [Verticillium dahliae]PNH75489.1 hypothetical protein VD0001_g2083 [Verticillium dahliae]RBQ72275.1 hypothetical protein VDGD_01912 [Verticillium dahliae]RXG50261.1 hypothetical protein VDGE_01912 [Verticillium dahliae]
MSFYQLNLGLFTAVNAGLLYRQYIVQRRRLSNVETKENEDDQVESQQLLSPPAEMKISARRFQLEYFSVYALAVGADWLQGPHIYAMYKYEKQLPEKLVAALYAAGFISGAVSASFAGGLADRYGRRLACLIYCATYILTCLSMVFDNIIVLFLGRLSGGISTTLLYSVFEAWLITEYHQRDLARSQLKLGTVFGNMTTLSSIVAIASGVLGDALVSRFDGARVWPFLAAAMSAAAAAVLILKTWPENYGTSNSREGAGQTTSLADMRSGIRTILGDKRIWGLGLTSTFFEGTMYLFVFFWSAALKSARTKAGSDEELPFGLIFSSFMCAMMAGSALFSLATPTHTKESSSGMLMMTVLATSCCLSAAVLLENEQVLFWTLCVVEMCIGAYFPSMSYLKSEVVEDGVRGRVYSILRLPLNLFVVVAHSLDQEGDGHRNHVFLTCAALLMLSFFIVKRSFSS